MSTNHVVDSIVVKGGLRPSPRDSNGNYVWVEFWRVPATPDVLAEIDFLLRGDIDKPGPLYLNWIAQNF